MQPLHLTKSKHFSRRYRKKYAHYHIRRILWLLENPQKHIILSRRYKILEQHLADAHPSGRHVSRVRALVVDIRMRYDGLEYRAEQRCLAGFAAADIGPHRRTEVLGEVDGVRHVPFILVVEHELHVNVISGPLEHAAHVNVLRVSVDQLQPAQSLVRPTDFRIRIFTS